MDCPIRLRLCLVAWLLALAAPAPAAESTPFHLGVINERPQDPNHALNEFGKLHSYLAERLGRQGIRVGKLVIARDLNEMATLISEDQVQAVIEGLMSTLVLQRRTERLQPALVAWRKGQREYHSVFFVRRDSGIDKLADLAGRTLVFEAPRSTSAYLLPKAELVGAGLVLAYSDQSGSAPGVVYYRFAGSEENQAYWVERGIADAGAFNNGDWQRLAEPVRNRLRIIHRTRPMLRWLLSFETDLDPAVRSAVSVALVDAEQHDAGREALQQASRISRFEPLSAADRSDLAYWSAVLSVLD